MIKIDETKKSEILKWIFTHISDFIIRNEFMDAERVYIGSDQKMYWENWSPRENITFSTKEINVGEAWDYTLKYASEWIEKARTELKI